jgi:hypothetical protein
MHHGDIHSSRYLGAPVPGADERWGRAAQAIAQPTRVSLVAASRQQLERLAARLDGQAELQAGPRLTIAPEATYAPPLVTPLALCDMRGIRPQAAVCLLADPASRRRGPFLIALVDRDDLLTQRLLLAAPDLVCGVAPHDVAPALLGDALRLLAAPTLGGGQLWFGGLSQPPAPWLTRAHDLQLIRLLICSGKLAEAAGQIGYTRRGIQAQLGALYRHLQIQLPPGRRATHTMAEAILASLAAPQVRRLALTS